MPMSYVCDMDGVIYHGSRLIPGALEFVQRLQSRGHKFLFLTNNSQWTPRDLKHKLEQMGISVDEAAFHTSALATAEFLGRQKPGGTAYVIGGAGLTHALYSVGFTLTENNPDYVVVGETRSYDYEKIERAVRLILKGARFIATNPDLTGHTELGITPACGALVAPIELATGKKTLLRGQAQPADDVDRPRDPSDGSGRSVHGRRPYGHRHHCRYRGRHEDDPRSLWRHDPGADRNLPLPSHPYLRGCGAYSGR